MEWNLVTIGILFAVLIVGYLIGLLEANSKASRKARQSGIEVKGQDARSGEVNVLSLWVDIGQNLYLDLDGERVDTQALTAEQRRRLIALLTYMRPWLEVTPASQPTRQAVKPVIKASAVAAKEAESEEEPVAPVSMVAQIDAILQARLTSTPLAGRGIRLQESPEGGVIVQVGVNKYQALDEIPDPEVQAVIRAAISEWEKGMTPR